MDASKSSDPDGDQLNFRWWQYAEAGSYKGNVALDGSDQAHASFIIPADAKSGDTLHFICDVTDNGTPALTRYQRVVVTVK